ncbi:Hypothetical predicted protein [Paramuricea clavata]|uniref:Reverse transcriptase domain-containing protein n=1 Tax=Paramuricea clavata TaxID=317549 RepID=A0A7D9JPQ3_PARCT|nr:Hypothetical predicted protein [Paramuricea clavata]
MAHVDPQCFCGADEETLEHLFFECRVARLVTGWIFFNLLQVDPTANKFTVDELLFGFTTDRRRKIPLSHGPGVWKFNTFLLDDADYCSLVRSFWTFWKTQEDQSLVSPLDWWDQDKFYLCEVTRCFARARAAKQVKHKRALNKQLTQLQRRFDAGDSAAFAELCSIQEELCAIHLRKARASQVRARCRWAEEGETSSAFFLSLEKKHRAKQSVSSIRDPDSGIVHHDPFAILGTWQQYYQKLFTADVCDAAAQDAVLAQLTRTLSKAETESCEGLLTIEECHRGLAGMFRGKTPGSDGFPMEIFVSFWDVLGVDLVRVLNCAYVDYKIATRAISGRLLGVIGSVVGSDQTCGVPGRTILENLTLIRDLIEYADRADMPLALLSLDQEKAFDRVDWAFLQRILSKFGFGDSFRQWICLFYTEVQSAVVINGWTSSFFQPSRGVRQGCPLSPRLYVLCIEALACMITASPDIEGVALPGCDQVFKYSGYAYDTSIAVTSDVSMAATFDVYALYEKASGAKLNRGKSKGMWLGAWKSRQDSPYGIQWVKELRVLGGTFSAGDYSVPTWEPPVSKLEQRLSAWKGRQLTLQGKGTVINMLALSQIWHLCHVFVIPEWAIKRIKKAVWAFFWSGRKDLVARRTVCLPKAQGGFGVINFELKAKAFSVQWVRRYFSPTPGKWKAFFSFFLLSCLSIMPVHAFSLANFPRRLISLLPSYYQFLLRAWFQFDGGAVDALLSLDVSSNRPHSLPDINSHTAYVIGRRLVTPEPHCIGKFRPTYSPLYWSQSWDQVHLTTLDRPVVDVNWKIAHSVLYTASRLVNSFGMANINVLCHCRADEESLEHLFFECAYARILVGWVFVLMVVCPSAPPFTVEELLFGVNTNRCRNVPKIILWMLQVVKHHLWVARCDFRFCGVLRTEAECLKAMIARLKFLLKVVAGRCRSPSQIRSFEKQWLANNTLGHFEGEKLVFSF